MSDVELSIVLPCYRAETYIQKSIQEVYSKLLEFFKDSKKFEIIVVIDGTVDNSLDICKKLSKSIKNLKIIGYKTNMGKGYAIKKGVLSSRGKYVGFLDADLDISVENFLEAYKKAKESEMDIVIGSKYVRGAVVRIPFFRRILSIFFILFVKLLFPFLKEISDTQVGCKVFKGNVAKFIFKRITIKRFAFDVEILVVAKLFKFKVGEVPVSIHPSRNSILTSKLISSIIYMLRDVLAIAYRTYILRYYFKK